VTVITPVFIWRTPFAGVVGFVLAAAVVMGPALWLMLRAADTGAYRPEWSGIKDQLKFAVPLGLASMVGQINLNMDKILVSKYFDPEVFAVYVNGAMEIPLIGMITGSATAVLLPDITRMLGAGNHKEALELWKRAAVKCALVIFPVMGFLMVVAPELMTLLYGDKYIGSAVPFRIYLLLLPIRIAFFGVIFMGAGKSNLILIRSVVGLILNLILSILLMRLIGYLGAVIATVIVTYFWAVGFNLEWMKKYFSCRYRDLFPWMPVCRLLCGSLAAALVSLLAAVLLESWNPVVTIGIAGGAYFAVLATLYQVLGEISIRSVIQWVLQKVQR
jgi:O-antigen/teichoic acid export membrane protein